MPLKRVYLSLGSNEGDREANLRKAICELKNTAGIENIVSSPIYETEPQGYKNQGDFLNLAVRCDVRITPLALLREIARIEELLLRRRSVKDGPRTADIDILIFEGTECETRTLTLPHPRMCERAFVITPLADIWAESAPPPKLRLSAAGQGVVKFGESPVR